uniref:Solute carrier family 48 member 1 n=1 Tax=Myotis myotis TaxID=51298 RepID=A0A7J7Z969_MYOMY|nr:solute carrier family 48 member 1 [Myotis myotis]
MAPSRRQLGLRAAYSGLSSVAGFSIFIVWTVVYSQPWTAAMGGLAGLLEDLAQGAAWLLLRGRPLLSCLHCHLLQLPCAGHHPTPEPQRPQQLLPVLRLELHCLQVGLPAQPLRPPLPG